MLRSPTHSNAVLYAIGRRTDVPRPHPALRRPSRRRPPRRHPFFTRLRRVPRPSSDCPRHDAVHSVAVDRRGLLRAAERQATCPRDAHRTDAIPYTVVTDPSFARAAVAHAAVLARPSRSTWCHPPRGRGPRAVPSRRYCQPRHRPMRGRRLPTRPATVLCRKARRALDP